jgi:membrane protease YdiL (CAAX protease family)
MKSERTTAPDLGFLKGGLRNRLIVLLLFLVLLALVWPLHAHLLSSLEPGHRTMLHYRLFELLVLAESLLLLVVGLLLYSLYYGGSPYYLLGRVRSVSLDFVVLPAIAAGALGGLWLAGVLVGRYISPVFEPPSFSKGSLTADLIPGDLPGMWRALIESGVDSASQEVLYRGLMMGSVLALTRRPWMAIVVQAIIFAVSHGVSSSLFYFFPGLLFGYVAFARRSLWPVIVAHIIANGSVYFYFPDPDFNLALRTLQWLGLLK